MVTVEQELIERIHHLDDVQKQRVLEFVRELEQPSPPTYTALELMKLPYEERSRLVMEAFQRAQAEDFEIFEAYSEEDLDNNYYEPHASEN